MTPTEKTIAPKIQYVPDYPNQHGYWKCSVCHSSFYGGGSAIHSSKECTSSGYSSCVYHYGDAEIHRLASGLTRFGLSWLHGCFTELAILKAHSKLENLEALLKQYEQDLFQAKSVEKAAADIEVTRKFLNQVDLTSPPPTLELGK
ncbi:hypothetical protein ACQ4M3_13355 [Leptolyngbya sp. AN03gr2]|uniref:hypothetical protein n=1 Tax=unclassified Leptolyngbya TaxID=2650499 RepID=UPI003D31D517